MPSINCDVLLYDNEDNPCYSLLKNHYGKTLITFEKDKKLLLLKCKEVNFSHHYFAELTLNEDSSDNEGIDPALDRVYVPYQMIATVLTFHCQSKVGFHS